MKNWRSASTSETRATGALMICAASRVMRSKAGSRRSPADPSLQRLEPLGVARRGGRVEQGLPALGAVRHGRSPAGRSLRSPEGRLEVGIAALAHRVGGAHDRGVADELGGADALAVRLVLDQRPERFGKADGGRSHRHRGTVSPMALPLSHGSQSRPDAHPVPRNATGPTIVLSRDHARSFEAIYAGTLRKSTAPRTRSCATRARRGHRPGGVRTVWRGSGHDERRGPLGPYLKLLARSRALDLWRRTRSAERTSTARGQADSPPAPAAAGGRDHPRRRPEARARRGAPPTGGPASGHRARLLGRPVAHRSWPRSRASPRHGEEPRPAGAGEAVRDPELMVA